jgi:hypothetical protein
MAFGKLLGPNWVEMEVPANFNKMGICINENSFVATLKKVPSPTVSAIEIDSVGSIEPMHEDIEVAPWGHKQEVEVVFHQDVSMNLNAVSLHTASEQFEEFLSISPVEENRLSFISPASHVVPGTRELYAQRASHEETLSYENSTCQINN